MTDQVVVQPESAVWVSHPEGTTELRSFVLSDLPTPFLSELFETAARRRVSAFALGWIGSINHYEDVMYRIYRELRKRRPEGQRALLPLLDHPDDSLKVEVAHFILDFEPEAALKLLRLKTASPRPGENVYMRAGSILSLWKYHQGDRLWISESSPTHDESEVEVSEDSDPLLPDEPDRDAFVALLEERGLGDHVEELEELVLTTFQLHRAIVSDESFALGSTKLGGLPDLPLGTAWPLREGRSLSFLGQVRLSELAALGWPSDLPNSGMLSFFYDADAQPGLSSSLMSDAGVVLFVADDTPLVRLTRPADLYPELVFRAAKVRAKGACSLPLDAPWLIPPGLTEDEEDVLRDLASDLRDSTTDWGRERTTLQVRGYADPLQNAMEPELAEDDGAPEDWTLLAQFREDEPLFDLTWGDGGSVFFWIRREDLAEQRFDKVIVMGQW